MTPAPSVERAADLLLCGARGCEIVPLDMGPVQAVLTLECAKPKRDGRPCLCCSRCVECVQRQRARADGIARLYGDAGSLGSEVAEYEARVRLAGGAA